MATDPIVILSTARTPMGSVVVMGFSNKVRSS